MKMIRMPLQLYVSKKILGNVLLNCGKAASKFLQFTNRHIHEEEAGKRVSCSIELGLEIPVNDFFMEMQEL